MPSAYPNTSALARQMLAAAQQEGVPDRFDKGGLGALLLAQCLHHKLAISDKGFDGIDGDGASYEYKCSLTDQYNFHFGARKNMVTTIQPSTSISTGLQVPSARNESLTVSRRLSLCRQQRSSRI